jgi:hypothetical protein
MVALLLQVSSPSDWWVCQTHYDSMRALTSDAGMDNVPAIETLPSSGVVAIADVIAKDPALTQ